jgi:glycosyl hydrolase family 26
VTGRARTVAAVAVTIVLAVATVSTLLAIMKDYQGHTGDRGTTAARQTVGNGPKATDPRSGSAPKVVPASLRSTGFSYLGVYEGSDTSVGQYAAVEQFAHAAGRQPNLVLLYSSWGEPFSIFFAQTALQYGATLVIDIDPTSTSCAAIAAGQQDAFLQSYAHSVRAFGHPVIISFGHEMNGNWYPWGWTHTQPALFVQAWRHLVHVFRQAGADNVSWLWTINSVNPSEGPIADYWPGASYVTWIALDAYYYFPHDNFTRVFGSTITAIRQVTNKPILISETAIGQVAGQVANIPGLFAGVSASGLLGFIWFDNAQDSGIYHQDWRLEGHPGAVAAFRAAVDTYLRNVLLASGRTPGSAAGR